MTENTEITSEDAQQFINKAKAQIAEYRGWFIALGILLIVLGTIAIIFPFMTTIAAKVFLGWVFLISGVAQIVHAFSTKTWSQFALNILMGLLYLVAGAYLAFLPLTGILTLTILLAVLFIVEGVIEAGMAFRLRPQEGSPGWPNSAGPSPPRPSWTGLRRMSHPGLSSPTPVRSMSAPRGATPSGLTSPTAA